MLAKKHTRQYLSTILKKIKFITIVISKLAYL